MRGAVTIERFPLNPHATTGTGKIHAMVALNQ
jgi:hypothetical protein